MKHCGRESCLGNACDNWPKCRSETIPPWNFDQHHRTTANVSIREQDVLAASDSLSQFILDEMPNVCLACLDISPGTICETCRWYRLGVLAVNYQRERKGTNR